MTRWPAWATEPVAPHPPDDRWQPRGRRVLADLWDQVTPVGEVMATLAQTVVDGKARTVGLSNVPAWYAIAASMLADRHGWAAPVALQLEYSLLERTAEIEHVPAAQHCGMSLVPWSRWPTVSSPASTRRQ